MTRTLHALGILGLLTAVVVVACGRGQAQEQATADGDPAHLEAHVAAALGTAPAVTEVVRHTESEWREALTDEQYHVLRESGTERAYTGYLWDHHGAGTYHCAACGNPLFSSATKFESGTGWPSYYEPIQEGRVAELRDGTHGMVRTEIRCARCDGHLGHIFDDGPPPTGLRYCINSAALTFSPAE